jgi:hypothetical protein
MRKTTLVDSFTGLDYTKYRMPLITVYDSPSDYPGKFIARLFDVQNPTEFAVVKNTLEEVRMSIPFQHRLERRIEDDPNIVEVWL